MSGRIFLSVLALLASLAAVVTRADDNLPAAHLQTLLDSHLRGDVAYWVDEPRLYALLRENNQRNATLTTDEIRTLDARWQQEVVADDGELSEHMLSRFASKYLAEVALRMDGAYQRVVALDNRGLVAAASDLTDRYWFGDDNCVATLQQHGDAPWVLDRQPAPGTITRVALPLKDPQTGERIGTLVIDVDVARLERTSSMRAGDSRVTRVQSPSGRSAPVPAG